MRWTEKNFVRALRLLLHPALGKVNIFVDTQIESGVSWPPRLAKALACSKVLIPILSRNYFQGDWCCLELALMLDREQKTGFRCQANPSGLILPIVIDDGDCFPPEISAIQSKQQFHEFANPDMCLGTPTQERFTGAIKAWTPDIEMALQHAPPFDPNWEHVAHDQFLNLFKIRTQTQTTVPRLSLAPIDSQNPRP